MEGFSSEWQPSFDCAPDELYDRQVALPLCVCFLICKMVNDVNNHAFLSGFMQS